MVCRGGANIHHVEGIIRRHEAVKRREIELRHFLEGLDGASDLSSNSHDKNFMCDPSLTGIESLHRIGRNRLLENCA